MALISKYRSELGDDETDDPATKINWFRIVGATEVSYTKDDGTGEPVNVTVNITTDLDFSSTTEFYNWLEALTEE